MRLGLRTTGGAPTNIPQTGNEHGIPRTPCGTLGGNNGANSSKEYKYPCDTERSEPVLNLMRRLDDLQGHFNDIRYSTSLSGVNCGRTVSVR